MKQKFLHERISPPISLWFKDAQNLPESQYCAIKMRYIRDQYQVDLENREV